jgi:hypothetical protein
MVAQVRNCDGCAKLQAQLRERDRQVAEWIERGQAAEIERDRLQKELENERWHYAEALTAEGRADAENASLRRELAEAKQEQARWESVAEMAWKQKDESDAALFVKNFDAALAEARGSDVECMDNTCPRDHDGSNRHAPSPPQAAAKCACTRRLSAYREGEAMTLQLTKADADMLLVALDNLICDYRTTIKLATQRNKPATVQLHAEAIERYTKLAKYIEQQRKG